MERMLFARTHKAAMEEALVRRREAERVRGEFWSGAANYFDRMERANGRFASWTSDQSYKARYMYREAHNCLQNIIKKDPGRSMQNS